MLPLVHADSLAIECLPKLTNFEHFFHVLSTSIWLWLSATLKKKLQDYFFENEKLGILIRSNSLVLFVHHDT